MRFEGVFVATATPFDSTGKVALSVFENHLEWLADQGVHGFVPCATTGEGATLTRSERVELIRISRKVADQKKLKIFVGAGSYNTLVALELIREAKDLGADAALVVTPYYNKPTQSGLLAHYHYLANHTDCPILLYNVPSRTSVNCLPETTQKLLTLPNIVGIKEATPLWSQWLSLSNAVDWREKSLFCGDDDAFAPMMALGGAGLISGPANVAAGAFVRLYDDCRAGRWEKAFEAQKKLQKFVNAMFMETNPAPVKFALSSLGIISEYEPHLRLPLVNVSGATETAVADALKDLKVHFDL
jgi:4-hydroxy-tetrahydrodipicolinate synthase